MARQTHHSDPRILCARTLEQDQRALSKYLKAGMRVLDVGCGAGSITAGIALAVGPSGFAVGLDKDEQLLEVGREKYAHIPNLNLVLGDMLATEFRDEFDLVTSSRALQWVSEVEAALSGMIAAAKSGGRIVVLDYTHDENRWHPEPPAPFSLFYRAFLNWRSANNWDNRLGERLPGLFQAAGLESVCEEPSDEVSVRGDDRFAHAVSIWQVVIETIGPRIVDANFITEAGCAAAAESYRTYCSNVLEVMEMRLRTVSGKKG